MQYAVNNISKPALSAPPEPAFEVGKTALTIFQKGTLDVKTNVFFDREEILENNPKRVFTILHGQCTESLLNSMGGYIKHEAIEHDKDVIGTLKLIKGVMFKLDGNKEVIHALWEA